MRIEGRIDHNFQPWLTLPACGDPETLVDVPFVFDTGLNEGAMISRANQVAFRAPIKYDRRVKTSAGVRLLPVCDIWIKLGSRSVLAGSEIHGTATAKPAPAAEPVVVLGDWTLNRQSP